MDKKTFQLPVFVGQTKKLPLVEIPTIKYQIGSYLETPNPDSTGGTCKSRYVVYCDIQHGESHYRVEETTENFADVELHKIVFVNWAQSVISELLSASIRYKQSIERWNALSANMRLDDSQAIIAACDVAQSERGYNNAHLSFFDGWDANNITRE